LTLSQVYLPYSTSPPVPHKTSLPYFRWSKILTESMDTREKKRVMGYKRIFSRIVNWVVDA
jgi:hypothetical protein